MGKSSSVTVGFRYRVAYHHGLASTPIDAFLQFRAADKVAWSGKLTASGTITINAPNLFGGDKDQGGIAGDVDVMFGESTQVPNAYLVSTFGNQVPGWRGVTTLVFKGGVYGAMNPYPQKPSYQILATKAGWDDPGCWYPEKCEVPVAGLDESATITSFADGFETNAPDRFQLIDGAIANTTVNATPGNTDYWRTPVPVQSPTNIYCEFAIVSAGRGDPMCIALTDAAGNHLLDFEPLSEDVFDATQGPYIDYWDAPQRILDNELSIGVGYSFEAAIDRTDNTWSYWLRQGAVVLASGSGVPMSSAAPAFLAFGRSNNAHPPDIAVCKYTLVRMTGSGSTMNPAHILYELRTAKDRGAEPRSSMNDASWRAAADWFYNQGFGLCTEFDPDRESVDDAIARIEKVAGCSVNLSPVDGQWYLDVANGVYDLASLPILTDDDILDWGEQPTALDDAINSVSVEYYDPQKWATVTTPPVQALALITTNGLNHDVKQFHELPTADLANRVAQRELTAVITPTKGYPLTTNRKPWSWRRNTYFRLQSPKRGIADMVCILAEKDSGTLKSGAMKITASQDIYSLPATSFVQGEPGVDTRPSQIPVVIADQTVFESPYIEVVRNLSRADLQALPSDVGYVMTLAKDPAISRDYTIQVSTDGGNSYAGGENGPFCPTAVIAEADTLTAGLLADVSFSQGVDIAAVGVGSAALWGTEIVRIDAIDAAAATLTLARGCADTVPQQHAAGERIWFFDGFAGSDRSEYTDPETIDVKLLTNTGSQQLDPALATALSLTFAQRQYRPYPPGSLTINGERYPAAAAGAMTVAWAHRDRLQQADQLIDTIAADVGPEAGVTYTVRYYQPPGALIATVDAASASSAAAYTFPADGRVAVAVSSVRNGVESLYALAAEFDYSADSLVTESGDVIVSEDGLAITAE